MRGNFKWGLAGYGDLAEKRVASALQDAKGSALHMVWGRDLGKAREFAQRHKIPHAAESYESLITSDVDGIYVCTPPDTHCEYTIAALARGKHVLVEKPMAENSERARLMIETAERHAVTLGVAYYRRGYPKMQKIKGLIDEGVLGTPVWCSIAAHSWFNPEPNDPKYWRVERNRSGGAGALADIGVHRLDLLSYWLGRAQVVYSNMHRLVHNYDVEDGALAVLELKNGAPVHTYFSWNSKTWIDRFEITGSEGKIIAEPLDGPSLTIIRGREREELNIDPPSNPHQPLIEDFCISVREKRKPLCSGEDGLEASRLLELIIKEGESA